MKTIKVLILSLITATSAMAQGVTDVHSHITTPDHLLYGSDYPYVAPQVLTQSLRRMKQYLTTEADLAPYRELILWKNAQQLFQIKQ